MKEVAVRYSAVARALHWGVAFAIIAEYLIGLSIDTFGWKNLHLQLGFLILLLVSLRIVWRLTHRYPQFDDSLSRFNSIAAHAGHGVLYLLTLIIPLLGVVLVVTKGKAFNVLGIPFEPLMTPMTYQTRHTIKLVHVYLAHTIIIIAAGHALMALLHQFVYKHPILSRMLPEKFADIIEGKNGK